MEDTTLRRRQAQRRSVASLRDVANLSGVSTATASRALHSPELLDESTLARVRDAVRKLRYVPHGAARTLRNQRSYTIGAVVPSFDYALYARTTSALEQVLDPYGYCLLLASHHYDLANEVRQTKALIERGVEALLFVGRDHDPELYALLADFRRPYVLAWAFDESRRHPSIGFDNRAAARAMANHLLDLGHRRLGLITAPHAGNDRARERTAGVREALAARGLALDPACVKYGSISLASGHDAMRRILALPERPTALLATNDVFAVGAMMACREAGVHIPDEMSITGSDNTDLGATQTPGLTTIRTPIVEIGRAAGNYLLARLDGQNPPHTALLPFELVIRGSTSAIAVKASP